MFQFIARFLKLEAASGIILMVAAGLALLIANSPFYPVYHDVFHHPLTIQYAGFTLDKPLVFWINDGLMVLFFFLIGLEIKREFIQGHLSEPKQRVLPLLATLGGVVVPALLFTLFNHHDPINMRGWAIPTATDIAFALGVLTLAGNHFPRSLKVLLLTIAVLDDLSAVLIIAVFYGQQISLWAVICAGLILFGLFVLNRLKVKSLTPYLIGTFLLWLAVLNSGIHATVAGVLAAMMIPIGRSKSNNMPVEEYEQKANSPLLTLEYYLHPIVAYFILPVFAFANSGLAFKFLNFSELKHPIFLGIFFGLFLGKQLGIFSTSFFALRLKWCKMPEQASLTQLYSVAVICGIGFTMSLFMGSLAFQATGLAYDNLIRAGVMLGSLVSIVLGVILLRVTSKVPGFDETSFGKAKS